METWIFWGCAALAVVGALSVVGQARPARAFAAMPLPVGGVAALCLLLSAPLAAAALALLAAGLVAAGWWVATTLGVDHERANPAEVVSAGGARRLGVALVVLLVLELAWVFRRVRGASLQVLDPPSADLLTVGAAAVTDYAVAGLLVVLLLIAVLVGGSALLRRERL